MSQKNTLEIFYRNSYYIATTLENGVIVKYYGFCQNIFNMFEEYNINIDDIMKEAGFERTTEKVTFNKTVSAGYFVDDISNINNVVTWYYCELGTYEITKRKAFIINNDRDTFIKYFNAMESTINSIMMTINRVENDKKEKDHIIEMMTPEIVKNANEPKLRTFLCMIDSYVEILNNRISESIKILTNPKIFKYVNSYCDAMSFNIRQSIMHIAMQLLPKYIKTDYEEIMCFFANEMIIIDINHELYNSEKYDDEDDYGHSGQF